MKKTFWIALILIMIFALTLVSCDKDNGTDSGKPDSGVTDTVTGEGETEAMTEDNLVDDEDDGKINLFSGGLVCFFDGEKWGYANTDGEVVIEPQYVNAYAFAKNGLALVSTNGTAYGYINTSGEHVIAESYISATGFNGNGLAIVWNASRKAGVINARGETVVEFIYDNIHEFDKNGLAIVVVYDMSAGKTLRGVIDIGGETVFPVKYEDIYLPARSGNALVKEDGLWGIMNGDGEWVTKPRYATATEFNSNNPSIVSDSSGEFGVINHRGDVVVKPSYESIGVFSEDEGLAFFCDEGKYGIINTKGEIVVESTYDSVVSGFCEGRAIVVYRDDYIAINKQGEEIFEFEDCIPHGGYSNGLVVVQEIRRDGKVGKFGYMDKRGKLVIEFDYASADAFYPGKYAMVCDGKYYGFVDKKGSEVISIDYDGALGFFSDGYAVVFENGVDNIAKCIILNKEGDVVLDGAVSVRFLSGN